jgi:hypothetical protein
MFLKNSPHQVKLKKPKDLLEMIMKPALRKADKKNHQSKVKKKHQSNHNLIYLQSHTNIDIRIKTLFIISNQDQMRFIY